MPRVGKKHFPYTAKGKKQAASARKQMKAKPKPKSRRGKY